MLLSSVPVCMADCLSQMMIPSLFGSPPAPRPAVALLPLLASGLLLPHNNNPVGR